MQNHLDQGCDDCLKIVATWTTLVEFARRELFYEPPAGAVRNAESYFFSFGLTLKERANVRILRHVFDSCDCRALNGIRGAENVSRQLMYNSNSVFIDLRVEQNAGSDWAALIGQVVDAHLTDGVIGEIQVLLLSKGDTALETSTNQFGEFTLAFKAIGQLGLLISMKYVALLLLLPDGLAGGSVS